MPEWIDLTQGDRGVCALLKAKIWGCQSPLELDLADNAFYLLKERRLTGSVVVYAEAYLLLVVPRPLNLHWTPGQESRVMSSCKPKRSRR